MIPKTLHYCWFGGKPLPLLVERCIESWKETNPDFIIKRWDETTFDVQAHPFTKRMYTEKKWAFVADYARLMVLYEHGGIYLDTDMELVKSLTPLLDTELLLGKESDKYISCGMIGAVAHHPFIYALMQEYNTMKAPRPNPLIMTELWKTFTSTPGVVLPPIAFYPYTSDTIKTYHTTDLTEATYGVHLWNYSWGHPLNRLFKKIGIYRFGKRTVELLHIKSFLKKLLGFV
jgi:mannosyltransferase OCH1-like enzyme